MIFSLKILVIIRRMANRKDKKVNPNIILFDFRGHKMRAINYWEQFLSTGKIDDYLAYREKKENGLRTDGSKKDEGAGKGAGTGQCYRDYFKSRADGGI